MEPLTTRRLLIGGALAALAASAAAAPTSTSSVTFQMQMTITSTCAVALDTKKGGICKVNCSRHTPFQLWWPHDSGAAGTGAGMAPDQALPFETNATPAGADSAGYGLANPIMLRVRY